MRSMLPLALDDVADMSIAPGDKPATLPERYVLGTPRLQLVDLNRLASLGLPRRVPLGDHGRGTNPAESYGNKEQPSVAEERPASCLDSVGARNSLSSADSSEARKRKAERDAPICRERTLARQEEGRTYGNSRRNLESVAEMRNHNAAKEALGVLDKENINPFHDPGSIQPKKQVLVRSSQQPKKQVLVKSTEKRQLQVLKSLQNMPTERKVGSLLVKHSSKLKSHFPKGSGSQLSFVCQDGSMEKKQCQQITATSSKACSKLESVCCAQAHRQADGDMLVIPADSISNLPFDPSQEPRVIDVPCTHDNKKQDVNLQGQDGPRTYSLDHAELQDISERSVLVESNQRDAILTTVKELSSSMNSLALGDSLQPDGKRRSMLLGKNVQGSFIRDEKAHEAHCVPAACPSLPAQSVPSATSWSYTVRTGSAPLVTSHTAESVQPLGQQNFEPSSKESPVSKLHDNGAIAVSKNVAKGVRPTLLEDEVIKVNQQRLFQDNLPISDVGSGRLIQHLNVPDNKSSGGDAVTQPKKQFENESFVWVNRRRYQKLKKVGRGGSSEVYKVIDRDGDIYALKRIKLKGRDYATAYGFYQEIELLTKLQGKNYIIRLIDHEVTDKNLFSVHSEASEIVRHDVYIYMVLEYGEVDLATMLHEKLKERGAGNDVDETWLRFYWQQILEAVNTVHEERIIHADLKPANFLLVRGVLKLIDFGIAKSIQGDTTNIQRDAQVGTLNYMSPEAFLMNEKDEYGNVIKCGRPSDIWALGCILYQMVYGKTPFAHITALHAKIQEVANPNHKINFPPVSNPHLLDIMKKCLAYKREERLRIPELLNHPFLQPQRAQSPVCSQVEVEILGLDVRTLTKRLRMGVQSQVETEKQKGKSERALALARFLEQLKLFEEQLGEQG